MSAISKTTSLAVVTILILALLVTSLSIFTSKGDTTTSVTTRLVTTTTTATVILFQSSSAASSTSSASSSATASVNKTEFIMLNNLAQAAEENLSDTYMIRGALQIMSETNQSESFIHVWTEGYSQSVTINETTASILSHDNRCILLPIGPGTGWPVDSIYNYTNFPYPVTVYVGETVYDPANWGIIANNTGLPKENYFVVGYVTNGLPFIIYASQPNATINISVSNKLLLNFTCA